VISLGRPPVKSTRALVKAKLEAEAKFKTSEKGLSLALIEMMDRIDPLELLAVASGTFMVYDIIKSTPELLAQVKQFIFTPPVAVAWPLVSILVNKIFGSQELTLEQQQQLDQLKNEPDLMLFVKSFFISYVIVKHSGKIISGVGNITGFIAGFLGLKVT
jgi:hypothetical protein